MKIKSQKDFWTGLMFLIVGIGFAWGATNYSFDSSARPGPGYFPFGLGILLALLGVFLLVGSLVIKTEDGEPIGHWGLLPLSVIMFSVALFGYLLPRLGMALSLPILIIITSLASDEFHWKDCLISIVVLTLGSCLIFIYGLNLVIPLWPKFISG